MNQADDVNPESPGSDIIVIDDDDDEAEKKKLATNENVSLCKKTVKRKLSTEMYGVSKITKIETTTFESEEHKLKTKFGDFGGPLNRQLKCPKCNKFKSKRISDFIFHMYKETRFYR